MTVSVFKKGPDYIDSAWLGAVGEAKCRNLDTYMVSSEKVRKRFSTTAARSDLALIEGNRGIFDGKDVEGSHTTAGLAALLQAPVVLTLDASKATRTLAALVNGCVSFEPDMTVAGIILNKVAGERHRNVVTESIEKYCGIPVMGALPKLGDDASIIPGRHLGLVTPREFKGASSLREKLVGMAESYIDVDGIVDIAARAETMEIAPEDSMVETSSGLKIGCFDDSVFSFYYPENLEALRREGLELISVSSLDDGTLPEVDALYIGGGFPETQAGKLSENQSMMLSVRNAAGSGMPIYAECGGLIYLCKTLKWKGNTYPMTGVFPVDLAVYEKPAGHGYTLAEVDSPNPFFDVGTMLKGHEFHYSAPVGGLHDVKSCMKMLVGEGVGGGRDALIDGSTLACYTHLHADGATGWAQAVADAAAAYRTRRNAGCTGNAGPRSARERNERTGPNRDRIGGSSQAAGAKYVAKEAFVV
jgi:cobyrinic acid a,c-diamide synthase